MNEIIELGTIKKLSESLMVSNQAIENSNKILQTICLSIQQLMENDEKRDIRIEKMENKVEELVDYKNKYESLAKGILIWDVREAVNRMVRTIANKVYHGNFKYVKAWNDVFDELRYKYAIDIKHRQSIRKHEKPKPTIFDVLIGHEINILVKVCIALCDKHHININDLKIEEQENNELPNLIPDINQEQTGGFIKYTRQ